jgi:hypothetical protein
LTCCCHAPPPQEAAWTAVETTLHDRDPCRRVAASDRPCIGCSNLPSRLRVASAVLPMPVRNARRRGIRMLRPSSALRHGASRPRTSPRWGADLIVKGSREGQGRLASCSAAWWAVSSTTLPARACGSVAERRGRAWQPTHPPGSSLQPMQGRRRRSLPDPVRRQVGVAFGRRLVAGPGGPLRSFTGALGRARLGRWQPRPRRHDFLA